MERIEWIDSGMSFAATWLDESTITDRADAWHGLVITVGQVVHETEDRVVLGLSQDAETGHWSGCFLIWKASIQKRVKLTAA